MAHLFNRQINPVYYSAFLFFCCAFYFVEASPEQNLPVFYKSRYRPAEAYARLWLYDIYHAPSLKSNDIPPLFSSTSALDLLWSLSILGSHPFENTPLFWIKSAEIKQMAQLSLKKNRFSYQTLKEAFFIQESTRNLVAHRLITYYFLLFHFHASTPAEISEVAPDLWVQWQGDHLIVAKEPASSSLWKFLKKGDILAFDVRHEAQAILNRDRLWAEELIKLLNSLKVFESLKGDPSSYEQAFQARLNQLQQQFLSPDQIEKILEQEYPLSERLKKAGILFKILPSRHQNQEGFSPQALALNTYQVSSPSLEPINNFTFFSDEHFETIRQSYLVLKQAVAEPASYKHHQQLFADALMQAYQPLAGKIYQEAYGKNLFYPSLNQLKVETLLVSYPWIFLLILLYLSAACLWFAFHRFKKPAISYLAWGFTLSAFLCHTLLLISRCYILERPPVSNMFESVLYVPWVTTGLSLIFRRQALVLLAACFISTALLVIIEITNLNQNLDQVQPVLDSQFWLLIHVLLIVGSYGFFILAAILGQFYLIAFIIQSPLSKLIKGLSPIILQILYGGVTLLILGTLLGGVWAAESWGRFWDWDPKESWAFISICFYLIFIHAYRFQQVSSFGLAFGAVSGLLAISFTWYGVNYILGTGLHSYGFGSGGEMYYYSFLAIEILFLAFVLRINLIRSKNMALKINSKVNDQN